MISASLTYFDIAVISIMLLSCIFAFFRGFVKEVLSLGAWVGAGLITVFYFRDVAEMLKPHFTSEMVAGGVAMLGLYITCLMVFALINRLIVQFLKEGSDVGFLDNALGLLFGALRGAFVVSLSYLLLSVAVDKDNPPAWLAASHTRPYAEEGAAVLARVAPEYLRKHSMLIRKMQNRQDGIQEEPQEQEEESVISRRDSPRYSEHRSREMERLLHDMEAEKHGN